MIELSFWNFHEQKYREIGLGYCLYVMKNGSGRVLYVGISVVGVWERWFGRGGQITWDRNIVYGESPIGVKIENHISDSLRWKIQLWTLEDCMDFCEKKCPDLKLISLDEYKRLVRNIERPIIKKLSPALNRTYNLDPGKDTTPKSQKEISWQKYVDKAYDEIFNNKS